MCSQRNHISKSSIDRSSILWTLLSVCQPAFSPIDPTDDWTPSIILDHGEETQGCQQAPPFKWRVNSRQELNHQSRVLKTQLGRSSRSEHLLLLFAFEQPRAIEGFAGYLLHGTYVLTQDTPLDMLAIRQSTPARCIRGYRRWKVGSGHYVNKDRSIYHCLLISTLVTHQLSFTYSTSFHCW